MESHLFGKSTVVSNILTKVFGNRISLTSRPVSTLEDLARDYTGNVCPAVHAHHDAPRPFPGRVAGQPDGEKRATDEDSGHADVGEAVAELGVC